MAAQKQEEIPQQNPAELYGEEFVGWDVPEYPRYKRGSLWYAGMSLAGIALLIYAVASANFLFALIIMMFALIVYLTSVVEPKVVRFAVTETGVRLGTSHRTFRDINRFWVVYQPPQVRSLYIEFKSAMRPRMIIDLRDMNPNEVRRVLGSFVAEDLSEDTEPLSDFIGRILKI